MSEAESFRESLMREIRKSGSTRGAEAAVNRSAPTLPSFAVKKATFNILAVKHERTVEKMKKTIGILGGMGPEATAYFFELIIKNTEASSDQGHIPILIWNNPRIPPRTCAIQGTGPAPWPHLLEGVEILRRGGAGFVVMPCITAHYFFPRITAKAKIPVVNLVEESLRHVRKNFPKLKKAGLIASTGTVESRLFHRAFAQSGIEVIAPTAQEQEKVMAAIFGEKGIKAGWTSGPPRKNILGIARKLIARGAEAVIAGCTEIPLVLKDKDIPVPLIEPMEIGALACIKKAGYKIRES